MAVSFQALDLRPGVRVQLIDEEDFECVGTVHRLEANLRLLKLRECRNLATGTVEGAIQAFHEDAVKSILIVKEDAQVPGPPSPSGASSSSKDSSSSLETHVSRPAAEISRKEAATSQVSKVSAGKPRNCIVPVSYREQRNNPHLDALHHLDMDEILSQRPSALHQPAMQVMKERGSVGDPLGTSWRIQKPTQVFQHQDQDELKHRFNQEFEAVRSVFWRTVQGDNGPQPEFPGLRSCPSEYFFDRIESPQFSRAVSLLLDCSLIGVSLEAEVHGRCGNLGLLLFSNKTSVFVFDVHAMGHRCFDMGLGEILESDRITKVFHDVRLASDMLFHKYGIQLENVYDTLAAHCVFVTWKVYTGYMPEYATSVSNLARGYFGISTSDLFYPHYRVQHLKEDMSFWIKRPLAPHFLMGAVRNVMYLLDLQWATRECMMSPFYNATKVFLEDVKKCDDFYDAKQKMYERERLPEELKACLPTLQPDEKRRRGTLVDNERRRIHNAVGQADPNISFSRDCLHQKNPSSRRK